jgi:hypothetical protein
MVGSEMEDDSRLLKRFKSLQRCLFETANSNSGQGDVEGRCFLSHEASTFCSMNYNQTVKALVILLASS